MVSCASGAGVRERLRHSFGADQCAAHVWNARAVLLRADARSGLARIYAPRHLSSCVACCPLTLGDVKIALRGGGGGGHGHPPKEPGGGGAGLEKWACVLGPLFCVRSDVGAEGAGTQNLARKLFFHQRFSTNV